MPRKNVGADGRREATPMTAWSTSVLRRTAEITPTGTATSTARTNAVNPSSPSPAGTHGHLHGRLAKWIERPKSARTRRARVCTRGVGRALATTAASRHARLRRRADFGRSIHFQRARPCRWPWATLPATAELGLTAVVLACSSRARRVISAVRRNTLVDQAVMGVALVGQSRRRFFLGILFI